MLFVLNDRQLRCCFVNDAGNSLNVSCRAPSWTYFSDESLYWISVTICDTCLSAAFCWTNKKITITTKNIRAYLCAIVYSLISQYICKAVLLCSITGHTRKLHTCVCVCAPLRDLSKLFSKQWLPSSQQADSSHIGQPFKPSTCWVHISPNYNKLSIQLALLYVKW